MKYLSMVLLLTPLVAFTDEPPSWPEYRICGDAHWFCVDIARNRPDDIGDASKKFRVRMWDRRGEVPRISWEREYDHPGYGGGLVTADGKYFVYVEQWYRSDSPVVLIHGKTGVRSINGAQFHIKERDLIATVSHFLWLDSIGNRPPVDLRGNELILRLIDGRVRQVNLDTGAVTSVLPDPEKQSIWQSRD